MYILVDLANVYSQTGLWSGYSCNIPGDFPLYNKKKQNV